MNDIIEAEVVPLAEEEAEYQSLLVKLDEQFPPVVGKGLDLTSIQGNIEGRTAKAIVLHLTCNCAWSIAEIAELMEASTHAVSRYLTDAIRESFPLEDVEIVRKWELMKLDAQAKVCLEGRKRSFEDAVEEVTTWECEDEEGKSHPAQEGEDGAHRVIKRTRKRQSGNPAWEKTLMEIAKQRDKLLGLAQTQRVEVDKTERKLQVTEIVVRNRDEAMAAKEAGLLGARASNGKDGTKAEVQERHAA